MRGIREAAARAFRHHRGAGGGHQQPCARPVNADVLIEMVHRTVGVDIEVIDGSEAARLYFEALRSLLSRCENAACPETCCSSTSAAVRPR